MLNYFRNKKIIFQIFIFLYDLFIHFVESEGFFLHTLHTYIHIYNIIIINKYYSIIIRNISYTYSKSKTSLEDTNIKFNRSYGKRDNQINYSPSILGVHETWLAWKRYKMGFTAFSVISERARSGLFRLAKRNRFGG